MIGPGEARGPFNSGTPRTCLSRPAADPLPQKALRLGVTVQPLTDQLGAFFGVPGNKGVLVASVEEGSRSAGKLKSGDVIISVDGKSVADPDELNRLIRAKSEGSR